MKPDPGRGTGARVLLVEDDAATREAVARSLEAHGYGVTTAGDAADALRRWDAERPDLILLDLGLPDLDGSAVVRHVRRDGVTPILILSARADERDKVATLDAGADDYVTKPFGRQELLARIEALLRRAPQSTHAQHYDDGSLSIDYGQRLVLARGLPVRLTPLEFRLLATLVEHAGHVLSGDQLVEHVWGNAAGVSRDQVKLYVSYVRKKLGKVGDGFEPIETVRGFGYRYVPPAREPAT
jgi:DNA-binding response OmpR family regulator